jgi:hypothetical protein
LYSIYFLKNIFKILLSRLPTEQLRWYISERVEKELLQMSLLLLTHRRNYKRYFIGDVLYLPMEIPTEK